MIAWPWMESSILAPLLGGLSAAALGRGIPVIAATAAFATATASIAVAARVASRGTVRASVSGWARPLGIELRADGFSAILLAALAVVGVLVTAYALLHLAGRRARAQTFFPLWLFAWTGLNALLLSGDVFNLSIDIADVDVGENIGAKLQIDQANADKQIAQAKAEERRAMAVAEEQEMRARVVEAESEVPQAMAEAFRKGNLGIMDYYRMRNVQADTVMRESIGGGAEPTPKR